MIIKSKSGFTIIEVMLVLGITGMLILISFIGQGSIREQTQFTNTAEDFLTKLEGYKSEATRTAAVTGGLTKEQESHCSNKGYVGQRMVCVNIGILVDLNDVNPSDGYQYKVSKIIADRTVSSSSADDSLIASYQPIATGTETFGLPYNVKIESSNPFESSSLPRIAFIRHPYSGSVQTYVLDSGDKLYVSGSGDSLDTMNDSTLSREISFKLVDDYCNEAEITVNQPANKLSIDLKGKTSAC